MFVESLQLATDAKEIKTKRGWKNKRSCTAVMNMHDVLSQDVAITGTCARTGLRRIILQF